MAQTDAIKAASANEILRKTLKPNPENVEENIDTFYGHLGFQRESLKRLESYDDANYYFSSQTGEKYLIKYYNGVESVSGVSIIFGYSLLLQHISQKIDGSLAIPVPIASSHGSDVEFIDDCMTISGAAHRIAIRVFSWIPGVTLNASGSSASLMFQVGRAVGNIARAVSDFDHEGFHRIHAWDLKNFASALPFSAYVDDGNVQTCIASVYEEFSTNLLPASSNFAESVIMGDCNDANVIVSEDGTGNLSVSGVIDFGDAVYTWKVNDIAIALCYALLSDYGLSNPLETIGYMLTGYLSVYSIPDLELTHMKTLIATRLSLSVSCGAYSISKDPTNEYLKLHAVPGRKALVTVWSWDTTALVAFLRAVSAAVPPEVSEVSSALLQMSDFESKIDQIITEHKESILG